MRKGSPSCVCPSRRSAASSGRRHPRCFPVSFCEFRAIRPRARMPDSQPVLRDGCGGWMGVEITPSNSTVSCPPPPQESVVRRRPPPPLLGSSRCRGCGGCKSRQRSPRRRSATASHQQRWPLRATTAGAPAGRNEKQPGAAGGRPASDSTDTALALLRWEPSAPRFYARSRLRSRLRSRAGDGARSRGGERLQRTERVPGIRRAAGLTATRINDDGGAERARETSAHPRRSSPYPPAAGRSSLLSSYRGRSS